MAAVGAVVLLLGLGAAGVWWVKGQPTNAASAGGSASATNGEAKPLEASEPEGPYAPTELAFQAGPVKDPPSADYPNLSGWPIALPGEVTGTPRSG